MGFPVIGALLYGALVQILFSCRLSAIFRFQTHLRSKTWLVLFEFLSVDVTVALGLIRFYLDSSGSRSPRTNVTTLRMAARSARV